MARAGHDPVWPDKAMFASMMLILGGVLGALFALLLEITTVDEKVPEVLRQMPGLLSLILCTASVILAWISLRTQTSRWAWIAVALGVASVGFLGLTSFLALVAAVFLLVSMAEGEETRGDGRKLHPDQWPDKALAASLFLAVGGLVAVLQAIAMFMGRFEPYILPDTPTMGILSLLLGGAALVGAYYAYALERAGNAVIGAIALILSLAFYALGPALGIGALVLVWKAAAEGEFR